MRMALYLQHPSLAASSYNSCSVVYVVAHCRHFMLMIALRMCCMNLTMQAWANQ